ncbi:MAG TPA: PEP-CTERM sorting domain-containing protein, partial [Candidatus Methylacidiphilales bacterium]
MKTHHQIGRVPGALGLLIVVAGMLMLEGKASAQVLVYTDVGSYDSASKNNTTVTFNTLASSGSDTTYSDTTGVTTQGVTFTANSNTTALFAAASNFGGSAYSFPGDSTVTLEAQGYYVMPPAVLATLPTGGDSAVALNIGGQQFASSVTALLTFSDGTTYTDTFSTPDAQTSGLGFIGFATTNGLTIKSISFTDNTAVNNDRYLAIDNFAYGTSTAAVPEPSSVLLMGLGLGA